MIYFWEKKKTQPKPNSWRNLKSTQAAEIRECGGRGGTQRGAEILNSGVAQSVITSRNKEEKKKVKICQTVLSPHASKLPP